MIYLDDKPISDWGLQIQQEHDHPAVPDIRTKTMTIPGMPGQWDFGSELGSRQFKFPLGILEYDPYEKQRKLNDFVAFLFDSKGKPKELKLVFDYDSEKYYLVKVQSGFSPKRIFGLAFFDLPLIANMPFYFAEQNYKANGVKSDVTYDSGFLYPYDPDEIYLNDENYNFSQEINFLTPYEPNYFYENPTEFDWIYSRQYCGIYNHSSLDTELILDIEGTVYSPKITNQTNGKIIYLPTIKDQTLSIDSSKSTVKIGDKNKLNEYDGDFIDLASGENSLLFEGGFPNAKVTYKWKHKFI